MGKKFSIKLIQQYPPRLMHVAKLPWEIKNSIFCRYSTDMEENANKFNFKCTDFNSSRRVTVHAAYICVFF